jgi:hypothetical protein
MEELRKEFFKTHVPLAEKDRMVSVITYEGFIAQHEPQAAKLCIDESLLIEMMLNRKQAYVDWLMLMRRRKINCETFIITHDKKYITDSDTAVEWFKTLYERISDF